MLKNEVIMLTGEDLGEESNKFIRMKSEYPTLHDDVVESFLINNNIENKNLFGYSYPLLEAASSNILTIYTSEYKFLVAMPETLSDMQIEYMNKLSNFLKENIDIVGVLNIHREDELKFDVISRLTHEKLYDLVNSKKVEVKTKKLS